MEQAAIGIDIGGTDTVFGIVDRDGEIIAEGKISTRDYPVVEDFVEALALEIEKLLEPLNATYQVMGVGVGAPNANFYRGTIENAPNLAWKGIVPLAQLMGDRLRLPVCLTNDANAAAMGEIVYGGAKGMKDFVVITLGTGLGSGFVAGGQLVYGVDGIAGEMGHMTVIPNGRLCECGRKGCLETYVSATGFMRTVREMLVGDEDSELHHICPVEELEPAPVALAAEGGDQLAMAAFEQTADILGLAMANMVTITAPEVIFLFGGFVNAGPVLWEPVTEAFEKYLHPMYVGKVEIRISSLQYSNAAVLGSSALVWKA